MVYIQDILTNSKRRERILLQLVIVTKGVTMVKNITTVVTGESLGCQHMCIREERGLNPASNTVSTRTLHKIRNPIKLYIKM